MKFRAALMAVCLIVVGLVLPASLATSAAAVVYPPRIMVIGDSITQGSAGDWTWRYRLYKHLLANRVSADMVGPKNDLFDNVSGQHGSNTYADPNFDRDHNAGWGRPALYAKDTIEAEVRAANPDYALILLGINDLAWFTDPATTGESIRTLITNARVAKPNLKIVLGRVLPTDRAADEPAFAAKVADLNARINTLASSMSTTASPIAVASTDAGFNAATDTWDGVHPNARGEYKVAAAFADALKAKFGLGAAYPRPLPSIATGPRIAPTLSVVNRDGKADLSWTQSPGATGYIVWTRNVSPGASEGWHDLPYPLTGRSWTAGLLANGGAYEFKLQTTKGRDTGVYSNVVTARPSVPTPAATTLQITPGNGSAQLSWTPAPNAAAYVVWTREVTEGVSEDWHDLPIPLTATSWTAGQLRNGGAYQFKLQSINGYQTGGYSNVATALPTGPTPGATTLTVTPANRGANLSWTAVPNATAYSVLVKNVALLETEFTRLPVPITGTQWKAEEMSAGAAYRFKVQPLNGYIKGVMSNEATVTPTGVVPAAPQVSVSYNGSEAHLNWAAVNQATHYDLYERNLTVGETNFHPVDLWFPLQGTTYQPWLEWGETREFYLVPKNGLLAGQRSNTVRTRLTSSEFGDIEQWMTGQINYNSAGSDVAEMRSHMMGEGCLQFVNWPGLYAACLVDHRAYGLAMWADRVRPGAIWDHKPTISNYWNDKDRYWADVNGSDKKVFYDVWSNIHYGFVGKAAGITEFELIQGSHCPVCGETDAGDDLSVNLGFDLWDTYGSGGLPVGAIAGLIRANLNNWVNRTGNVQVRAVDDFS